LQKVFVIFVFSEHHVEQVVALIKYAPLLLLHSALQLL